MKRSVRRCRLASPAITALGFASLAAFLLYAAPAAHAQFTTTNLLTNPGAEAGNLTGWTVGGTSNPFVDNGAFDPGINPHTGTYDFAGGNGASGTLSQTVSLVGNQGITEAQIDAGLATANLSFWEQGLGQGSPSDDASVSLIFRDSSSAILATVDSGELDSHNGTWANFSNTYTVPTGTRTIDYAMNFIRHSGSDLDAFVDDNSLTVSITPADTPEPATLPLALTGFTASLGTVGIIRRRRAVRRQTA